MNQLWYDTLKERLDNTLLVLAVSVGIPLCIVLGADWLRRQLDLTDKAAILSWPVTNVPLASWATVGLMLGVVQAIVVWGRGSRPWWPLARWPWLVLALGASASVVPSLDDHVQVYPDRIVGLGAPASWSGEDGLRFEKAAGVEVGCLTIQRRHQPDIATLSYVVHFPGGQAVDLQNARSGGQRSANSWFEAVERLDRRALRSVPHGPNAPVHSVACIRALRAELGEPAFGAARRMLGISDADLIRYYAEPHEAFKRRPADGL
ncbi:MAG TPA: hypothetical protein VM348_01450 [Brevundimonas sp.]|nr:hypothetical protein [Brevundimonas sp.]